MRPPREGFSQGGGRVRASGRSGDMQRGVVAAGHELTAKAAAAALRRGGNAVDAAVAGMLTSFVAEPLLTGLGAGGYMIVFDGRETVLLDFFVAAPGGRDDGSSLELDAVEVSFGDAVQVFHIGAASCGVNGVPAGVCAAAARWGTIPLAELAEDAASLARRGVPLNPQQAYVARILEELLRSTPECAALWAPGGRLLEVGQQLVNPDLADSLERLGSDGAAPFYRGDIAAAVSDWVGSHGGALALQDLRDYEALEREPVRIAYRGRDVLTNPPPSAGGALLCYALALLDGATDPELTSPLRPSGGAMVVRGRSGSPHARRPTLEQVVAVMEAAEAARTPQFLAGLGTEGFFARLIASALHGRSSRLGATTHISVLDCDGVACGVTTSNGEGSGVVVPGTGIHLNNVMGERDLSPLGFHSHERGARIPSMMAPTVLMRGDSVEAVLGSAGSSRIRSALLQTIIGLLDAGCDVREAVNAPRVHVEEGVLYHEPGVRVGARLRARRKVVAFHDRNLFFGGVQAVQRRDGMLLGAGDPRRGGVAVVV